MLLKLAMLVHTAAAREAYGSRRPQACTKPGQQLSMSSLERKLDLIDLPMLPCCSK